jgi:hypothetical protein
MSTSLLRGNILKVFAVQISIDVTSKSAATSAEQDITVTGVESSDIVIAINKPSLVQVLASSMRGLNPRTRLLLPT